MYWLMPEMPESLSFSLTAARTSEVGLVPIHLIHCTRGAGSVSGHVGCRSWRPTKTVISLLTTVVQ